jgi:hypothetical protein
LFGRGIVASVDNFGILGQRPTHPELLDFLANKLSEDGWSIKRMIKSMVMSGTYRMSSRPTDTKAEAADPEDLLLHRARLRRLQGETIRDAILAISGRFDRKMFGPSVAIYLTPFMQGRGRPKKSGPLDGDGRRSIYIAVRRNFLSPMMLAFDTPIPFNAVGRRSVSNVPAQALILLNDPFVIQQAQVWAKHVLSTDGLSTTERIGRMYAAAFSRPPSDAERANASEFLQRQSTAYGADGSQPVVDARAWSDLGHVLMNVKEFIYVH